MGTVFSGGGGMIFGYYFESDDPVKYVVFAKRVNGRKEIKQPFLFS